MSTHSAMVALANPTANDTLAAVPHHTQHATVNDFVQAIGTTVVYVKAFDAVGDGVTDDTAAADAAHDYANLIGAPVSYAGLTSIAIQANALIPVQTSVDFAGCELVILGGVSADPSWGDPFNQVYVVTDPDCPMVEVTGAIDAQYLAAGSTYPTRGLFSGHGYASIECAFPVPDRDGTGTQNYVQSFKVNRDSKASHALSVDLSAYAAAITVRYRRTSKHKLTIRGLTVTEGAWNQQHILHIERSNVLIENTTILFDPPGDDYDNIVALIYCSEVSDVVIRDFVTTGRPVTTNDGSYGIQIDGGADIWIERMNGIGAQSSTGMNDINGIHYLGCVLNRIDVHTSGHNIFVDDCTLNHRGVGYGWGGGIISVRNSRAYDTWVVQNREDWGGSFFGSIIVDNVEVAYPSTGSYYVVDLATNALGASLVDVYAPHAIRVSNITVVGEWLTNNSAIVPLRLQVSNANHVVYAPSQILVDNIVCTTLPSHWRFRMDLDLLNMERAPGALTTTIQLSNIKPTVFATSTTGVMDYDSIRTPTNPVELKLFVNDCDNFHARIRLDNGPRIVISDSGINGLLTATSGVHARVDIDHCRFFVAADGYVNPPVGYTRSHIGAYTSILNSDFASDVAFDCSNVSLAMGNTVRTGSTAPLIPAAATLTTFFTGFRESGAFQ